MPSGVYKKTREHIDKIIESRKGYREREHWTNYFNSDYKTL